MDVDKDTVQRQRQQLQQQWQGTDFLRTGTPITPIQFPSSCSQTLHTNIMDSVARHGFCTIRSRTSNVAPGLLWVEPQPWRSSNWSTGVPHGKGTKWPQQMPVELLHRSRNQCVVNHSRELPEIGNKVARQSPGSVRFFCFTFISGQSPLVCRDMMANALQRYPLYYFWEYNRCPAFVRIYPFACAKFINLLGKDLYV